MASCPAEAQFPQQTLTRYISDLQKNPNDYALREKIIRHVQAMRPAPAIPEETKRYLVRGKAAFKGAKEQKDFNEAAEEFKKALLYVPWLAEGYYNLGIIQDKAGLFADAMQSLKFYLMAAPNAPDAEKVKELIYEIEDRKDKVAKESSPQALAAKKRQKEEEFIKKIDGARYKRYYSSNRDAGYWTIDIRGNRVIQGYILARCIYDCETGAWKQWDETTLNGREFSLEGDGKRLSSDFKARAVEKGRISDDGYTITTVECNETKTYNRER